VELPTLRFFIPKKIFCKKSHRVQTRPFHWISVYQLLYRLPHQKCLADAYFKETQAYRTNSGSFKLLGLDQIISANIYKDETTRHWHCHHCDFNSVKRSNVKNHVESKHVQSTGFECSACMVICPTRNALNMHILRKHKKDVTDAAGTNYPLF